MVWRLQHLRSDGINLIAILAVVTFFFSLGVHDYESPQYIPGSNVHWNLHPTQDLLKIQPYKMVFGLNHNHIQKSKDNWENLCGKSDILQISFFSEFVFPHFSLYFQITSWYQHRENRTMVVQLFRRLIITSGLLWSNLIVVLIVLSHQI